MKVRPYIYYDQTTSLCSHCLQKVEAKILFQDEKVYMEKLCLNCRAKDKNYAKEKVLIATDIDYYKRSRDYMKASEMPRRFNTKIEKGCPDDCGLCEAHEQHSCLSIVEITDDCDLTCPVCYASSGAGKKHRSLEKICEMLDVIIDNEQEADVVQISGGEPTLHPDFFTVLDEARKRPIRHLMVNTNGVRIAADEEFVQKLAAYMPAFEIYLQFDSLQKEPLEKLRGKEMREIRKKALENLNKYGVSTSLVVTLQRDLNDNEIGEIIDFALKQPCVRGVTFQPMQQAGRAVKSEKEGLTLTEVRSKILEQSTLFEPEDLIPVPCHPDALCMGYALKLGSKVQPLTRFVEPGKLLEGAANTVMFEGDKDLQKKAISLFSTGCSPDESAKGLHNLLCCLPKIKAPNLDYRNIFRVIIMRFMDARDFDTRSVKKSCVHIVHPDGRMIPFDTMNLFYRG